MKDLRIVIVSWNVEKLLERNLRSLLAACEGLDWDCIVVDNASSDGSVELARRLGQELGRITVIANKDNRGFARACNQGMVGADARYVLLFNPDAEALPGFFATFVHQADERPRAGILGPKLIYPDGRYQQSVRGFPSFWSQVLILLKLHHFFPWIPSLRRYFADHLETDKEQKVDQVMGSCFLIRREVIQEMGGLDERYFIWFEEVDYCRMAKERGWGVIYLPSVTAIHHGGQSFGQVFSLKKQGYFNESMVKYFWKWFPGWQPRVLSLLHPVSLAQSWYLDIRKQPEKQWIYWLTVIVGLEIVSRLTVFYPLSRAIATIVVGLVVLLLTIKRPSIGLAMIFLELMIGSKGALLKIPNGMEVDGGVSLRMVLFATFLVGWIFHVSRSYLSSRRKLGSIRMDPVFQRDDIARRFPWLALFLLIAWGLINGFRLHNPFLISDANAWGFLILLFPVIYLARHDGEQLKTHAINVGIAALLWLPLKTLGLLYLFSHGIQPWSASFYLWLRRTGVGEATLITGNLFRLFLQSQIYAISGWLFLTSCFVFSMTRRVDKEEKRPPLFHPTVGFLLLVGCSTSILLSLSRSFWVGMAGGAICLLALSFMHVERRLVPLWLTFKRLIFGLVVTLVLLFAVVSFPYPPVDVGSLATLFSSRGSTSDAAAESRWSLLPILSQKIRQAPILGSGFGATVTYHSRDPRILAKSPDGTYTTYAFEWGWLEHWIKFGILGIPVMAWLLISLIYRLWRADEPWWLRAGAVSSLVAVAVLHIFTPYLNHPLGFGFLLTAEALVSRKKS